MDLSHRRDNNILNTKLHATVDLLYYLLVFSLSSDKKIIIPTFLFQIYYL